MRKICYSSEVYRLAAADLASLPDAVAAVKNMPSDEVILLIGKQKLWIDKQPRAVDMLLKGRNVVEQAVAAGKKYIPVRIAFESRIHPLDFISPLIRVLRYKYCFHGTGIYHISPLEIRRLGIERNFRTADNAYTFSNPKYQMPEDERKKLYNDLKSSMLAKGFDDRCPLDIMLCRNMGIQDTLNQGHHRMSIAVECNLPEVAVMFSAAGQSPLFLHLLFKWVARVNLRVKHFMTGIRK